ncbi:MAG: FxsA family protein, partial [Rhizobiaceae bacterium]
MRLILILLICLPLLEIAVLIMVGSNIGILATIGLVIFTGFLGSYLLRSQGITAFSKLRREMEGGRAPDKQMADAAMIVVAGIMLIIPGFVSDLVGIALFVPFVRSWVVKALASRVTIIRPTSGYRDNVVDLDADEFHRTDSEQGGRSNTSSSPWRL